MTELCIYNEKLKNDYICCCNTKLPKSYLEVWFSRFSTKEIELNKDLSQFTKEEILDFYTKIHTASVLILENINSQMAKYTSWTGYSENSYKSIDLYDLNNCIDTHKVNEMFIKRKDLLSLCEQMMNPRDKMVVLGLFEGIKGQNYCEFACMKNEDFDFDSKTVYLRATDRTINISDELAEYIQQTIETDVYFPITQRSKRTNYEFKKGSGYVLKPFYNQVNFKDEYRRGRNIYVALVRNLKYFEIENLSAQSIFESGIIYFVNKEAAKCEMSAMEVLHNKDKCELIKKQFGNIPKISLLSRYKDKLI